MCNRRKSLQYYRKAVVVRVILDAGGMEEVKSDVFPY